MLNAGFVYRLGVSVKDFGESLGHVKMFGWLAAPVIRCGLTIKDSVIGRPVREFR